jgi:hypothetical protein
MNLVIIIIYIIFILFICFKILKRIKDSGCLSFGFIFLLVFSVYSIFLSCSYMCYSMSKQYITGDTYNAKIVSFRTYTEKRDNSYTDSNGRSRSRTYYVTLHAPTLEFIDKKKEKKRLESLTHSGNMPTIGDEIKISYLEGNSTVIEHSFSTYFLLFVAFLFSIIFAFFSKSLTAYAFGYLMDGYKKTFVDGLLYGVKIGLVVFEIALIYSLYKIFTNQLTTPIWVTIFVIICVLALIPAIYMFYRKR